MNFYFKALLLCFFSILIIPSSQAQVLKKLKQKAERAIDRAVDKVIEKEIDEKLGTGNNSSSTNNNPNSPAGNGKKLTPPDVNMHLTQANAAIGDTRYTDAKFEIQQAILGVELEIGYQILADAPKSVNGMSYIEDQDQVMSNGAGFIGFAVGRSYESSNKSLSFSIVSNSILASTYTNMLTNASYTDGNGTQKNVNIDGNQGILKLENGNYELGIPLGQSSIILFECNGFADENEVLTAAKQFNLNGIKKQLGEQ